MFQIVIPHIFNKTSITTQMRQILNRFNLFIPYSRRLWNATHFHSFRNFRVTPAHTFPLFPPLPLVLQSGVRVWTLQNHFTNFITRWWYRNVDESLQILQWSSGIRPGDFGVGNVFEGFAGGIHWNVSVSKACSSALVKLKVAVGFCCDRVAGTDWIKVFEGFLMVEEGALVVWWVFVEILRLWRAVWSDYYRGICLQIFEGVFTSA